jgi:hypothetical protein
MYEATALIYPVSGDKMYEETAFCLSGRASRFGTGTHSDIARIAATEV